MTIWQRLRDALGYLEFAIVAALSALGIVSCLYYAGVTLISWWAGL